MLRAKAWNAGLLRNASRPAAMTSSYLVGRQPEAGGNSLQHGGACRIELIEPQPTDKELQVAAIPARTRAVSGTNDKK
jgi:hypothetical protein